MNVDMPPYDGVERRYHHTDPSPGEGRAIAARLLGLSEPSGEMLYDLSLYSGGIGVIDRLAITLTATPEGWVKVVDALKCKTPDEAMIDEEWARELMWLLTDEEEAVEVLPAALRVINQKRKAFQTVCTPTSRILFGQESNVNDWIAVWGDNIWLNYLAYSQG